VEKESYMEAELKEVCQIFASAAGRRLVWWNELERNPGNP
jgi:hypothetical protein